MTVDQFLLLLMSRFAALLLEHGRQLQRLTAATDAIMSHLRAGPSTTSPTLPPSSAAPHLPSGMASPGPSAGVLSGPRLSLPDKFKGRPELSKVSFLCSLLTGEALEWLAAKWAGGIVPFDSYAAFAQQLHGSERLQVCVTITHETEQQEDEEHSFI
uniref:Retrotransposon gag domain-containing protein n=1 Tax=Oryzias melastigma TaxID=30732 RepID=A0A3B3DI80_ORYME